MIIYGINGDKLLDAVLTESAEHEQELSKSNFVRLSWYSDLKVTIPSGSYIIPFPDGLKYRLLDNYTPSETDNGFKYEPEFQHPLMLLSRIPFLYSTTDQDGNPIKQQEWSFDGLTASALQYVCDAINDAFGITDDEEKFTFTLCGTVDASVSFSIVSNDILSALSSISQACKENDCEWHLSWDHKALYFGQVSINMGEDVPSIKVHENIQSPSVSNSKEAYYNCYYPQGSTKNMSRKAQTGTGNVATLARLGLDTSKYPDGCIYIGTDGSVISKADFEASGSIKQMLALSFDDIYPHVDLYAYNIRKRTRYLKNSTTGEYELDSNGNKKIYTVWYMRLAYCTAIKDDNKTLVNTTTDKDAQGNSIIHYWYDYDLDKSKQIFQGYTLKCTFKANTHATDGKYDALSQPLVGQPSGQDGFELSYHESGIEIPSDETTGDSGVSVLDGDYEIVMYQNGDTIIPGNESDGLIPRGNSLPDLTCNIVMLFNIALGDHETETAQEELASRTMREIGKRMQDNNNYTVSSNPSVFMESNPNLYIGEKVIFDDGQGYQLSTRVIKLVTKIDYPCVEEITVGNKAVKGTISQLKEDVATIMSGNWSGSGLNYKQVESMIRNFEAKAQNKFLRKDIDDTTPYKLGMGAADISGDATISGKVMTDDIHSSDSDGNTAMTGKGWTLKNVKDASGSYSVLAVDNIVVRKKIEAAELEIHKKTYVGAQMIASDWGHKVIKVEPIYADFANHTYSPVGLTLFTLPVNVNGAVKYVTFVGKALSDTETRVELLGDDKGILNRELETSANAFKVYFCESDGTAAIKDDLVVGSMAQVQEFNVRSRVTHNFTNSYYWGVCVAHGVEENIMIGGKATSCIYGVFAHTTDLITLTSEANGKTFSCYGMEQSGCTFPVVGDDMVGFGCADPYQDSDRCNAIVIASKDGENSAPSVIGYSGIGRKRAGKEHDVTEDPMPDYANIGEQYSLPSEKDDSRLDFRLSKKAGNVFKGDIYFRGKDGNLQPVSDTVSYALSLSRTVVAANQSVDVQVYQISAKDMKALTIDEIKGLGLSIVLDFGGAADSKSLPLWSNTTLSYDTLHPSSSVQSVGISLMKVNVLLATASLSFVKETEQTKVVRLIPVGEWAVVDFNVSQSGFTSRVGGEKEGSTSVFSNTLNVSLSYNLLIQTGNGAPDRYTALPEEYNITIKILKPNGSEILNETKTGSHFSSSKLEFNYSTPYDDLYNGAAYIYVILTDALNGLTVYDKRCIPVKLNNGSVFQANEKLLAYIYYGTDGNSGLNYTNERVTNISESVSTLKSWKESAEGTIENMSTIEQTAEKISLKVQQIEEGKIDTTLRTEADIDMTASSWDANTFYPVVIDFKNYERQNTKFKIEVSHALLDAYRTSSGYGTNANGFDMTLRWEVYASGWGARSLDRIVTRYTKNWVKDGEKLAGNIGQYLEGSKEYVYLRGGAKWHVIVGGAADVPVTAYNSSHTFELTGDDGKDYSLTLSPVTTSGLTEAETNMKATGIDVENRKIALTADTTTVRSNAGTEIAMFGIENGSPFVRSELIKADEIITHRLLAFDPNDSSFLLTSINRFGNGELVQYYSKSETGGTEQKKMMIADGNITYYNKDGSVKWVIGESGTAKQINSWSYVHLQSTDSSGSDVQITGNVAGSEYSVFSAVSGTVDATYNGLTVPGHLTSETPSQYASSGHIADGWYCYTGYAFQSPSTGKYGRKLIQYSGGYQISSKMIYF